jgi:mRNA degradation ribonuclease J1/J2
MLPTGSRVIDLQVSAKLAHAPLSINGVMDAAAAAAAAAAAVVCRFKVIDMLQDYEMGPFTVTPLRVTHSIPDCCGLIMRR